VRRTISRNGTGQCGSEAVTSASAVSPSPQCPNSLRPYRMPVLSNGLTGLPFGPVDPRGIGLGVGPPLGDADGEHVGMGVRPGLHEASRVAIQAVSAAAA